MNFKPPFQPLPSKSQAAYIATAFLVSTILTALFIHAYDGYVSQKTMLFSGSIASGKWALQIIVGYALLKNRRWEYITILATTCMLGSYTLLPYAILSGGKNFFFASLLASILMMAAYLVISLRAGGFSWRWQASWFALLATAVTLQLTVIFKIF